MSVRINCTKSPELSGEELALLKEIAESRRYAVANFELRSSGNDEIYTGAMENVHLLNKEEGMTPVVERGELLEQLKAEGYTLYVASSKPEWMCVEILEHFDLAKYFDIIAGASFDRSRSSKEDVITYLLEQCGESAEKIMVGDTAFDVIGAKAHGIPTVGVSWGYGTVEDMKNAGAVSIAYTMDELYEALK